MSKDTKVSKVHTNLPANKQTNIKNLLEEATILIESGMVPFKKPEDVVMVMQLANDLNMSIPLAIANIYPIQGKPSIGVHLWNALLVKGGVTIELIEDAVEVYHFKRKNGMTYTMTAKEIDESRYFPVSVKHYEEQSKDCPPDKEVVVIISPPGMEKVYPILKDKRTTIKMIRKNNRGGYDEATRSYYYHEAWIAGFVKVEGGVVAGKDNWIYHLHDMLYARACTRTGKVTGPDLTLGFREVSEMADAHGIEVKVTEDGDTTVDTTFEELLEENE